MNYCNLYEIILGLIFISASITQCQDTCTWTTEEAKTHSVGSNAVYIVNSTIAPRNGIQYTWSYAGNPVLQYIYLGTSSSFSRNTIDARFQSNAQVISSDLVMFSINITKLLQNDNGNILTFGRTSCNSGTQGFSMAIKVEYCTEASSGIESSAQIKQPVSCEYQCQTNLVSCNTSFTPSTVSALCQEDATWLQLQQCKQVECMVECDNCGLFNNSSLSTTKLEYNQTTVVSCVPGYRGEAVSFTCQKHGLNRVNISCIPANCSLPCNNCKYSDKTTTIHYNETKEVVCEFTKVETNVTCLSSGSTDIDVPCEPVPVGWKKCYTAALAIGIISIVVLLICVYVRIQRHKQMEKIIDGMKDEVKKKAEIAWALEKKIYACSAVVSLALIIISIGVILGVCSTHDDPELTAGEIIGIVIGVIAIVIVIACIIKTIILINGANKKKNGTKVSTNDSRPMDGDRH